MEQTLYLSLMAFVTSIISGMTGMGGGVLLLSFMAPFFAPAVLIPLHGLVQLASNLSRTVMLRDYVNKKIGLSFSIGALIGAMLGAPLVHLLPENYFRLILGLFILVMTWMPKIKKAPKTSNLFLSVGGGAGFISLFIGATGPFIAPFFLHAGLEKKSLVASKAFCQAVLHTTKMIAYFFSGFVLAPWIGLLSFMIPAVVLGNWVGKKILFKLPETQFRLVLKILISLAALRVFWMGLDIKV